MPDLHRPKIAAIYNLTYNWWQNAGAINYVAHAITAAPAAFPLANSIAIAAGGGPNQHPDQQYWQGNMAAAIAAAGGAAAIVRVEVDCTLMPCDGQFNGCLFRVPYLIRQAGLPNKPLRIFSHRDEGIGGAGTSKRYFDCNSSDNNAALIAAHAANNGWSWTPWNGAYP
ncbi:hypothetical protein [Methylomicrobium lacus]|uniref:hypothetical protein n=1 Tax=Methylomicrobium lacus TaxID=136992 RepID=UPI0035A88D7C